MNVEKRNILRVLNFAVVVLFVSAFFVRCASIMTPEGGPYDTLPPVIVAMNPDNFTTNFTGKKIYVEFDEYVKLQDQSKEFFVSPSMKTKPKLSIKGRGIVITLGDSLLENTTYALNFGTSIQDNNEGNPLYSMRYVFSTGNEIDSMIMTGYAEDSFKSDSVSNAMIFFFINDSIDHTLPYDSVLFNNTPVAIARAEKNGIFLAQNLKPIDYRVYAFEDRNSNFTYEPETDQVGFLDTVFNPANMPDFSLWLDSVRGYIVAEPQIHFKLFEDKAFKRQNLQESERPNQHQAILYFGAANPQIDSIVFDSIPQDGFFIESMSKTRDTLSLWFDMDSELLPDTIRGRVTYFKHDSIRNLVQTTDDLRLTWRFFESREQQREREKQERERIKAEEAGEEWTAPKVENPFKVNMTASGAVNPTKPLQLGFDYPLSRMDTAAISMAYVSVDSLVKPKPQPFTIERDTMNQRLWYIRTQMTETEGAYRLTIPDSTLFNVARQVNDSIVVEYTPYNPEEYSRVNIKFTKSDDADYILQLLGSSDKVLESVVMSHSGDIKFDYIPSGDIRIRLIQDTNKDGVRSSGNLVERLQPERVAYYEKDGESTFQTKVNWDFDFEVDASLLFKEEDMQSLIQRLEYEESKRLEKELNKLLESGGGLTPQSGGHNH
ncbi:MAG: Ig-like domain-containing protein [Rikenellaceae bacterium]